MRSNFQAARPTDAHAFHAVEHAGDERATVYPDFGDQCLAVVVKPRDTHGAPCGLPADGLSLVQPQTQANAVRVLAAHRLTGPGDVHEQRQASSHVLAKRLPFPREHRGDVRESSRFGHLARRFTLVDPRAQLWIRAAVEQDLDCERVILGYGMWSGV